MHRHRTRNVCTAGVRIRCCDLAFAAIAVIGSWLVTCGAYAANGVDAVDVVDGVDVINTNNFNDAAYAHPQQRIDIGNGHHLNLHCLGRGTPTVLFESGLTDWGFSWALVQPQIAQLTRACVYDRAGLGYSDAAYRASTSNNMVDDLHHLLQAAHVAPPYLLVGHSLGGLNVRLYADRFRDEIGGMVLVDPTHEDGFRRIDALQNNRETRRYAAEVVHAKFCLHRSRVVKADAQSQQRFRDECIDPDDSRFSVQLNAARMRIARLQSYQRAQLSEISNYANGTNFAEVRAARRWYGTLPLTVLTASRTVDTVGPIWLRLHQELATLSRLGVQRTVQASGHYIQLDQPQAVITAVTDMLIQARAASQAAPSQAAPATSTKFDYTAPESLLPMPVPLQNLPSNPTR